MEKQKQMVVSHVLAIVMCVGMLTAATSIVAATEASGTCGDNLTWTLEDGILTISGTGETYDYYYGKWNYSPAPWWELYSDSITTVIIEDVGIIAENTSKE